MSLDLQKMHTAKAKFKRVEEGTYMARISSIIDLGLQAQTDWQTGEPTDSKNRALITWELPTETIVIEHEDGTKEEKPRLQSKEYTLSTHEKASLTALIAAIKPDAKNLTDLLNIACMVQIGSTVNGNAKIISVIAAPGGMPVAELTEDATYFDFDDPSQELFEAQPRWIQEKVRDAENYTGFADAWGEQEAA